MFALGSAFLLFRVTQRSCHAASLTSRAITASQEVSIELRVYGTLEPVSALRNSAATTTKSSMPASIKLETNWQLRVPIVWRVFTTYSLGPAQQSCRATKTKSVKSRLTRKEIRLSRRVVTRHAASGRQRQAQKFNALEPTLGKAMKMKFSHAPLTTKEIQLLQAQKTTHAESGKTNASFANETKKSGAVRCSLYHLPRNF